MIESGKRVRLLVCATCKTIEELPWYEGPQECDDTGNYRMSFHRFPRAARTSPTSAMSPSRAGTTRFTGN
jgi:hypothetical protein